MTRENKTEQEERREKLMNEVADSVTRSAGQLLADKVIADAIAQVKAKIANDPGHPFRRRFAPDVADELGSLAYTQPEELLFVTAADLGLSKNATAAVKKYQRKYLPKRPVAQLRPVKGLELKRLRAKLLKSGDAEPNVKAVYYDIMPIVGRTVLIERSDGTAFVL